MPRPATAPPAAFLLLLAAAAVVVGPSSVARAQPPGGAGPLEAAGWRHAEWRNIPPARFRALPGGGVAVKGEAQASFVWRPLPGAPGRLSWRRRVDEGPPATDLTRRGGDDKALAVTVGFSGWPPGAGPWQRRALGNGRGTGSRRRSRASGPCRGAC